MQERNARYQLITDDIDSAEKRFDCLPCKGRKASTRKLETRTTNL